MASCPRKVYRYNELRNAIDVEDADACTLCDECVAYTKGAGLDTKCVEIDEIEDIFIFTVESTGALPPEDIVIRAMKILSVKLKTLSEHMKKFISQGDH